MDRTLSTGAGSATRARRPGRAAARATLVFAAVLGLGGCGGGWLFAERETRESWRDHAERYCLRRQDPLRAGDVERIDRIRDKGACGIPKPLAVRSLAGGAVVLDPPATVACPIVPATDRWLREAVQPAALAFLGSPVVELELAGSYVCKRRNGKRGARISEHSFGNALDIAAFRLADGRTVSVGSGWRGDMMESGFLRTVHQAACGPFKTVLGPDSDGYHTRHFHLDLARHNKDGSYTYCR